MNTYKRHRFPSDIISYAVWLYYRFNLSHPRINPPLVDQDGEVVDVFMQVRRDGAAAKRFFKRLNKSHGGEPRKIVTDKLRSYGVAHRELMPDVIHDNSQYANNRAEQPHEATRVRERGMRLYYSGLQKLSCRYTSLYRMF
jgi:transposase-like protein